MAKYSSSRLSKLFVFVPENLVKKHSKEIYY
jgi:hypothetical protein